MNFLDPDGRDAGKQTSDGVTGVIALNSYGQTILNNAQNSSEVLVLINRSNNADAGSSGTDSPNNPFGHTAVAVRNQGVYSFGTEHPPGSSTTEYIQDRVQYADMYGYVVPVTQEQADTVVTSMMENMQTQYTRISNNCNVAVVDALEDANIVDVVVETFPEALRDNLQNMVSDGDASSVPIPQGSTYIPPFIYEFNPKTAESDQGSVSEN